MLILSGYWPPHQGGVERYAEAMAYELASRGWEVHAAFSHVGSKDGEAVHRPSGIPIGPGAEVDSYPVTMLFGRLPVPQVWIPAWRRTRRTRAARPFDIVHHCYCT